MKVEIDFINRKVSVESDSDNYPPDLLKRMLDAVITDYFPDRIYSKKVSKEQP